MIKSPQTYDVCIIGSGAAGGMAAKVLTEGGLNVALLEAGPAFDVNAHSTQHQWTYDFECRGLREDEWLPAHSFWRSAREPYTRAPGTEFSWLRSRIVGGRTNHWGQGAIRFSETDFKPYSADGFGDDWPISYQDVSPYYKKVESHIGVFGSNEARQDVPDGEFLPPPPPRCTELLIARGCNKLGVPCIPFRAAILTRPLRNRSACHYCDQCHRACKTASCFSSSLVLIPEALATGRLTLIVNAMAREIFLGNNGLAAGVSYIDKTTRTEKRIHARAVVLAASACESARLLLNSQSSSFPDGLANSSGAVGRNLTDHIGSSVSGVFPELQKLPPHDHDGTGTMHMFVPWWKARGQNDFLRGYRIEIAGGRRMPLPGGETSPINSLCQSYGLEFKQQYRKTYGSFIHLYAVGEMVPHQESYCELDPQTMDEWGIPVLRFHFRWDSNTHRMVQDMQRSLRALIEASGGKCLEPQDNQAHSMSVGGGCFHELGTVRMGADPRSSVLNGFCQSHDVKNLFVMDGGSFVSNPEKPATLTILALAWRASDFLLEEARKGQLQ